MTKVPDKPISALNLTHWVLILIFDMQKLIDWCFTARQHKIGQFVPIYKGDYWLRRLRIANEEHTKPYSCMRYNEHTHATTNKNKNQYFIHM